MLNEANIDPSELIPMSGTDQTSFDLTGEDNLIRFYTFDPLFADTIVSTTYEHTAGAAEDTCGLIFRRQPQSSDYYRLDLNRESTINLFLVGDSDFETLLSIQTDSINTDLGAENDLVLINNRDRILVYVNGTEVIDLPDNTYREGTVALTASTFDESDISGCTFTQTRVWRIAGDTGLQDKRLSAAILAENGIRPSDLQQAESLASQEIDLTDEDDTILTEQLGNSYRNAIIATDLAWGPGSTDDYCGFAFRRVDGDNYYTVEIDRIGEARFFEREGGEWFIGTQTFSDAIRIEADAINTLVLVIDGTQFTLYVNRQEVLGFSDTTLASGTLGLAAGTFQGSDEAGCTFTNVATWRIE